jgi:hypothetical protein
MMVNILLFLTSGEPVDNHSAPYRPSRVTHNAKMVAPQASSSNEYMEMGKPSGEE